MKTLKQTVREPQNSGGLVPLKAIDPETLVLTEGQMYTITSLYLQTWPS